MHKILIADGQMLFCLGVTQALQNVNNFVIAGTAATQKELFSELESVAPEILLIDFDTVADFRVEEFEKIRLKYPQLHICVINSSKNPDIVYKVLKYGIINYIPRECDDEELRNALKATMKREKLFGSFVVGVLLNKKIWDPKEENKIRITNKEIEIIKLLAQGMTTKDIAKKIFISHHTVNTHRKNIISKLRLKNTSDLVMYAVRNGIVDTIEYYI